MNTDSSAEPFSQKILHFLNTLHFQRIIHPPILQQVPHLRLQRVLNIPVLAETKKFTKEDVGWMLKWLGWTVLFCIVAGVPTWFVNQYKLLGLGANDMQTLEIFVSVFGLAYAVIVGLLIIEAHGRMHELSSALRSELNAVSDIDDCLYFFNEKRNRVARRKIRLELIDYVDRLRIFELLFMKHSREGRQAVKLYLAQPIDERKKDFKLNDIENRLMKKKAAEMIRKLEANMKSYDRIHPFEVPGITEILDNVKKLHPRTAIKESVWEKLLEKICDLTSWRTNRLELAEQGLRRYLKGFVVFMSVVIVIGTILLEISTLELHLFMVLATTAGVVGLFIVLNDVDHPFSGMWHIDKSILKAVRNKIKP